MPNLNSWCRVKRTRANSHILDYFEADAAKHLDAVTRVAAIVPTHYASPGRVASILTALGRSKAADFVRTKLPMGIRSRSGDLGEILASSWIAEHTKYETVHRLRWKDHREMAMRGDDLIAVRREPGGALKFLKGEVKSRASLTRRAVSEARKALLTNHGRPTPHALAFLSDRLYESGDVELAEQIDTCQLESRIELAQIKHLMFAFTGGNPSKLLLEDLTSYAGKIRQHAVGLCVSAHQDFIKKVYEKVIADGD